MDWGPQRYGVIGFVVGGAVLVSLCAAVGVCCKAQIGECVDRMGWGARLGAVVFLSALAGTFVSVWAHFVPCFWLICDGGYYDDRTLRIGLLIGTGPWVSAIMAGSWALRERKRERAKAVIGVSVS